MNKKENIVYVSRPFRNKKHVLTMQDSLGMYRSNNNCGKDSEQFDVNTNNNHSITTNISSSNNSSSSNQNDNSNTTNSLPHTSHVEAGLTSESELNNGIDNNKPYVNKVVSQKKNHKHGGENISACVAEKRELTYTRSLDDNNNNSSNNRQSSIQFSCVNISQAKVTTLNKTKSNTAIVNSSCNNTANSDSGSNNSTATNDINCTSPASVDNNNTTKNCVSVQLGRRTLKKPGSLSRLKKMKRSRKRFTKSKRTVEDLSDDIDVQ